MTAETKARAACLIGWPAAHSRSPLIHHYWLRMLGIEGGYNIEAVPPEGFAEFVLHLSTHGFVGANVTLPHKEHALTLSAPDSACARSTAFLAQLSASAYLPAPNNSPDRCHACLSASDCAKAGAATQRMASNGSMNRKRSMLPPKAWPCADPNTSSQDGET